MNIQYPTRNKDLNERRAVNKIIILVRINKAVQTRYSDEDFISKP